MTETNKPSHGRIQGWVLQILNSRELVIDQGSEAGVTKGMRFEVLAEASIPIRSLDNDEVIDELDRPKVRVQVIEVRNRVSVCKTYETVMRGYSLIARNWHEPVREVPVSLKASDAEFPEPLSEEQSYVKRGDRVVQILDSD